MKLRFNLILLTIVITCTGSAYNSVNITTNWTLSFYKKVISPLQGQNICNFSPTCSQFYRQSINKYGFLVGNLMGSDRLQRCNPWAWTYLDKYYFEINQNRISDPPENHYIAGQIENNHPSIVIQQNISSKQENQNGLFDFADYLFQSKDFIRAIAEYKRGLFFVLDSQYNIKAYAQLMLGECYRNIHDYNNAIAYFSSNKGDYYTYGRARVYFEQGDYSKTRDELMKLETGKLDKERILLHGWSYFREDKFLTGSQVFAKYQSDSLFNKLSHYNGKNLKQRNRLLSSIFSAVIPGAGQVYSGRLGDGIYSFLTVVSSGLIASYYYRHDESKIKFSIFSVLTVFFWSGNIYGANIAARDYNSLQVNRYLLSIEANFGNFNLQPNYDYLLR